jgi:tRNA dimethylallyltransferase
VEAADTEKTAFPQTIILFGPTASGKTEILQELFAGEAAGAAEIVSADSMQVYRGMDIGTAKPSREERERLVHHLIDIRNPDEQFNAGDFVRLAREACAAIAGRGRVPVVSGGTGFYLKNLILGLPGAPPSDAALRGVLKEECARRGPAFLMEELARSDPVSAGRIHPNDEYRLLRALEVLRLTGKPLSSFAPSGGEGGAGAFRGLILGLRRPREELYCRIDERCAAMFRGGLAGEVRGLFGKGYTPRDPGLRAIGYREFFIESSPGCYHLREDLPAVEALTARNSRRYAKRQMTFFTSLEGVKWMAPEDLPGIRREVSAFLNT